VAGISATLRLIRGALGFADPRYRVGFGYVQNQLLATAATGDPRTRRVIAAIAEAIGAPALGS
jgi:hypothetical protein